MYYVGICDDDAVFIEYMKRLFSERCKEVEFYEYLSGEELLHDMDKREKYDLLILDVAMPGMDGNETAKKFREQFPDTILVFCSGVCMPTVESFETLPYRYWLKQYTSEKMQMEVESVLEKLNKGKRLPYILGRKKNFKARLSLDQVAYISLAKRGTVIHCWNSPEKYNSPKKLLEFYEQLKEFGFAYAHNSYIVNLKYVAIVGPKELEFMNGEKLTISRSKSKSFLETFAVELSKKYEEEK